MRLRRQTTVLDPDQSIGQLPEDATGLRHVLSDKFLAEAKGFSEKWDREWLRYFYIHDDNSYFFSYANNGYRLPLSRGEVAGFTAEESLTRRIDPELIHTKLQVFLPGATLVDKDVFEMGCGVGMLGRVLGGLARSYSGYDYSPLAIQIARLTSPTNCSYVHAADAAAVARLYNSFDTCLGRHFFIHNNFENSLWVLGMMRDLVRDDGLIHADFFRAEEAASRIFPAKSPLMPDVASCGFFYTEKDIDQLAEACGLAVEMIQKVETPPRVFVNFRRSAKR